MPASGVRRLRSTSTASAFKGETYSTLSRFLGSTGSLVRSLSIDHRNPASVLPEPVGAMTRALEPAVIASQAPDCAGVAPSNALENHR